MKFFFRYVLTIIFVIFFMFSSVNASSDRTEEVNQYIKKIKSSNIITRIEAAKEISNSGLTDPLLFDLINDILLNKYITASGEKNIIDEISWLCKALASSGNPKYKSTLEEISTNSSDMKIQNYALQSLNLVDDYAQRNKDIASTKYVDPDLSPESIRLINMIKSDIITLKRDGAKKIFRSGAPDEKVYDIVNGELLELFNTNLQDNTAVDTMAWFCKVLAASGHTKYTATLEQISSTTDNSKLKRYADEGIKTLSYLQ